MLALHIVSDLVIAASYFSIPLAILWFVRRREDLIAEHKRIALLFSLFILSCGVTHVLSVVELWRPIYVVDGWVKAFTALASIATAVVLWPVVPSLLKIPSPGQLGRVNSELEAEVIARRIALSQLEAVRAGLEAEVTRRTAEVRAFARRVELATAGSPITLVELDEELRYTWLHNPRLILRDALGRTDEDVLGPKASAVLTPLKRGVLETGDALRTEVVLPIEGVDHHYELQITPAEVGDAARGLLVAWIDITEQKRQQEHLQVILRELAHRAKNILSLVEGVARQTAKAEGLAPSFINRFGQRLAALGAAYDLLITEDWRGVDLAALVHNQLAYILPEAHDRISIVGPSVVVRPEIGQYLALALHELATNATKYGVLSQAGGTLAVRWRTLDIADGADGVEMTWTEHGAPAAAPDRSGFGRQLLETIVPRALGGEVSLTFGETGLGWRMTFPR